MNESGSTPTEPQLEPLEAHIAGLRAELDHLQLVLQLTAATLLLCAVLVTWRAARR